MATAPLDALVDAGSSLVNISCFELLLIELVPLAERMARVYEASLDRPAPSSANRRNTAGSGSKGTSSAPPNTTGNANANTNAAAPAPASTTSTALAGQGTLLAFDGLPSTSVFEDSVYVRLERLGFRVGEGLSERFSRDRPRFTDQLDVIKFLCKDLWTVVFKKQIDNLKTNHRVRYVYTTLHLLRFAGWGG